MEKTRNSAERDTEMKFGTMLAELRGERFLSKTELAKSVNSSRQMIARFEGGEVMPTSEVLLAIADYFGVSTDYLLGRDDYLTLPRDKKNQYIILAEKLTDEERVLVIDFAKMLRTRRK